MGFDIVDYEPEYGPMRPRFCIEGPEAHDWMFSLEEGSITLVSGCNLCDHGLFEEWESEEFEMAPIPVRLSVELEGQGDMSYTWVEIMSHRPEVTNATS